MPFGQQFERDDVLERAARVFWDKGYAGASLSDLTEAMGLNRSSLYHAFGDKERLYVACLEHYARRMAGRMRVRLDAPALKDALVGFFDAVVTEFADEALPPGCLAAASCLECRGQQGTVGDTVAAQLSGLERAFIERCERAVEDCELPPDTDLRAIAQFLVAVARGIAALHRGSGGQIEPVRNAVRAALCVLDAPPRRTLT